MESVPAPFEQIGIEAFLISPRRGLDVACIKPALLQQVRQTLFSPAAAIDRNLMNADQKWCRDDKVTARPQHRINISAGAHWPGKMFKHLVGDDQVELTIEGFGAYVEIAKVGGGI
jgi:hypothetical protein